MLRLYKIGNDSELVITSRGRLVPAQDFLVAHGFAKVNLLTNWVGVDGHASTLELRPRPFHNIMGIMGDLAAALELIHTKIIGGNYTVHASPYPYNSSPLGSHIHLSGYSNSPLCTASACESITCMSDARTKLASALAVIITPLEAWLQPRAERLTRYNHYGAPEDCRDQGPDKIPDKMLPWKRFYVEYRHPSTFLAHPHKALMYLGCAKLSIMNFGHVPVPTYYPDHEMTVPEGKKWAKQWFSKLKVVTADLKRLFYPVWEALHSDPSLSRSMRETPEVDFKAWKNWSIE